MKLRIFIFRIQKLITEPKREFLIIADENSNAATILSSFILPLVIINAIASFFGDIIFGPASFDVGAGIILQNVLLIAVVQALAIYVSAYSVNELLPIFQSKKNFTGSFKLVSYSFTPIFLATILAGLLPNFANVINFMGFYAMFVAWVGSDILLEITKEKKQIFVPVVIIVTGLIYMAIRGILGILFSI